MTTYWAYVLFNCRIHLPNQQISYTILYSYQGMCFLLLIPLVFQEFLAMQAMYEF